MMPTAPGRPPRPLDDAWLFADPMSIAAEDAVGEEPETFAPRPAPRRRPVRRVGLLAALAILAVAVTAVTVSLAAHNGAPAGPAATTPERPAATRSPPESGTIRSSRA